MTTFNPPYTTPTHATGATLYEQLSRPVVVAFDAGNLMNTALAVREHLPNSNIYLMADNDHQTEKQRSIKGYTTNLNPGIEQATQAAKAIGGYVISPTFNPNDKGSDFNDLYHGYGVDVFKDQIRKRLYEIKGIESGHSMLQSVNNHQEQTHDRTNPTPTQTLSRYDSCRATTSDEHRQNTLRADDRGRKSTEPELLTSKPRILGQFELIEKVNNHPSLSNTNKANIKEWITWLCENYKDSPDFVQRKLHDLDEKIPAIAKGEITLPNLQEYLRDKEVGR